MTVALLFVVWDTIQKGMNGEVCVREQVKVSLQKDGYTFNLVDSATPDIPPLLDPPEEIRSTWLTNILQKHEFIVLLFYRGLW